MKVLEMKCYLLLILATYSCSALDWKHVVFVVSSEENKLQIQESLGTKEALAILNVQKDVQNVHGSWAYFGLIRELSENYGDQALWFIILNNNAKINVEILEQILRKYSADEEIFLGHGLIDEDMTIIHHYDQPGLIYPHGKGAIIMSFHLVNQMRFRLEESGDKMKFFPKDFTIDPEYEVAKVIRHMYELEEDGHVDHEGDGVQLVHDNRICYKPDQHAECAIAPLPKPYCDGAEMLNEQVLFAVKTCSKYHSSRLKVVRATWMDAAINVWLVSEEQSEHWNTTNLEKSVLNTEQGHCAKTMAILDHFYHGTSFEWLVVVDDDTVLSVQRVLEQIACNNVSLAMGQRYGFGVAMGKHGYDYPTGGAGMIFRRDLVNKMVKADFCRCPKPSSPDDMHIGACITSLGVTLKHLPALHQARPEDYHSKIIEDGDVASFHKHWNTDPVEIYNRYFAQSDAKLKEQLVSRKRKDEEGAKGHLKRDEL